MKNLIKLILLAGVVTAFTACDKDGGGKSSNAGASSRYYRDQYGQCIDRTTGYPAPVGVNCGSAGQTCTPPAGYRYQNGVCYDQQNYPVNAQMCNCTTVNPGYPTQPGYPQPGYPGGYCNGIYYSYTTWGYQQIYCSQQNYFCRGLQLIDQSGRMTYCQ
jgi:hypothetical protein